MEPVNMDDNLMNNREQQIKIHDTDMRKYLHDLPLEPGVKAPLRCRAHSSGCLFFVIVGD